MNEITYSPGRLAKKIGVSRMTLMRHLHETGLIYQCYQVNNNRYWRIPYNVAAEIANPEALSLREKEASRHPRFHRSRFYPDSRDGPAKRDSDSVSENSASRKNRNRKAEDVPPPQRPKSRVDVLTQPRDDENSPQYYSNIGKILRKAGVTINDLIQGYPKKGEPNEQQQTNNPATGCDDGETK